jgi:RNase adaptor protein for sRNA GlmZ degradation
MKHTMYIVTGAPGAGKSTAVQSFIQLASQYIAFDIDWLAETASDLAGKNIYTNSSTWQPYNTLWVQVLGMVAKNDKIPLLFAPFDKTDIENNPTFTWYNRIEWLLLDCTDNVRRERLTQRSGWTETMITEAMADAEILRQTILFHLNTDLLSPSEIAHHILKWLKVLDI